MNLALTNTIHSKKLGFEYFDCTIMGMGRGAGNTKTEELLYEIGEKNDKKYNCNVIYNLILDYFKKLKKKYEWGSNIYYFLSAKNQIHPTYIQKMIEDKRYKGRDILSNLNILKNLSAKKFDINLIENSIFKLEYPLLHQKKVSLQLNTFKNKDILILGHGSNLIKYKKKILNFIKKNQPMVVSLNFKSVINNRYINYFCSCDIGKFLMDIHHYNESKIPLIYPKNLIFEENKLIEKINIKNFPVIFKKGKFRIFKTKCILPAQLSLLYIIAISLTAKVKNIYFAGIDGYEPASQDFNNVQKHLTFNKKFKIKFKKPFLTPSNFRLYFR